MSSSPPAAPAPTSPPGPPPSNATAPPPSPPAAAPPPSSPSPPAETPPPPPATPSAPPPLPSGSGGVPGTPGSTPPPPPGTPSPPSPAATTSPPTPGSTPGTPSSDSSSSSGLKSGVVAGIAVGGVVALLLACLLCVCLFKKKRKKRHHPHPPPPPLPHMHYYGHPPPPPPPPPPHKGDQYGGTYQNWQHNAPPPPPPNHVVNMQHPSPPPPPPVNAHSSGSASNNSGSDGRPPLSPAPAFGFSRSTTFTYEQLAAATDGFSDANLLGQGGFGYVHKGVLPNGKEVAVKQLRDGSGQGEREFQAEVEIISRVHHRHLVSLVGYCISGDNRLLVYEFVPNNTLEFHLHGRGRPTMDWPTRLKIALGSAKGLAYLHEDCYPKIIHRDIKAANILLDLRFEAKVADFGLAKLTSDNNTHVSTRVMGTFGYLAPEYASSGKLTEKSDVFSFGVMLLELITGRRPVSSRQSHMDDSLVDWARPLMTKAFEDGNHDDLVDPRLGNEYNNNEMERMIACAAACVRYSARRRPRMSQVVRALEGDVSLDDLNEGVRPGHSRFMGSYSSSDYDSGQYNEDLKKFKKMALGSSGMQSSQQTPTSEYGQNPSVSSSDGHQTQETEAESVKKDGDNQSS
ncbi:hypothetical protein QOZ80_1BG0049520 [Eleusine coracana subsp. coracana]|nr:hypothetical protein QOZ80_1BG0049520 [Eleusine coracana subsp. coracana]